MEIAQRGGEMWFVHCSSHTEHGAFARNGDLGAGFSFSCHWSQLLSPLAHPPGRPAAPPCVCWIQLLDPASEMMLGITALPPDEEQMLQESASHVWVTHFLLLADTRQLCLGQHSCPLSR